MSCIWLITSTSLSFGLELVRVAACQGDCVLAASQTPEKLNALVSSDKVKPVYLNHNQPLPQVQAAVQDILAIHGMVDIIVNNATYAQTGMLEEVSPEDTLRQFHFSLNFSSDVCFELLQQDQISGASPYRPSPTPDTSPFSDFWQPGRSSEHQDRDYSPFHISSHRSRFPSALPIYRWYTSPQRSSKHPPSLSKHHRHTGLHEAPPGTSMGSKPFRAFPLWQY